MPSLKYISFEEGGLEHVVIFGHSLNHNEVAKRMGITPLGAGAVCGIDEDTVQCYGQSMSLNVMSRREKDTDLVRLLLRCG